MEWLTEARGHVLFLDTSPFIYLVEEHSRYLPVVRPIFESLDRGELRIATSVLTLLETTVLPLRCGDSALVAAYLEILESAVGLELRPIEARDAVEAAALRSAHPSLRTPDAIQLAVARNSGATWFFTNDRRLPHLRGLRTIVVEDWAEQGTS